MSFHYAVAVAGNNERIFISILLFGEYQIKLK
jgi:hypothetical protein